MSGPPIQTIAQLGSTSAKDTLMLAFIVVGVLAVILLALVIALWLRLRKQKRSPAPASKTAAADAGVPAVVGEEIKQGYLENLDDATQHAIVGNPFRIGRHSSNHLPIVDRSVSRQHAEIHRDESGLYAITDMDSMNGVFVNNRQLKHSALSDGDLVELGDISFTFRLLDTPPAEQPGQATVMLDRPEPRLFIDDEPLGFEPKLFVDDEPLDFEPKLFIDDEPLDFEPDIFDDLDDDIDEIDERPQ